MTDETGGRYRTVPRPTEYVRDPDTGRMNAVYTPSSTSGEKRVTSYGYDDVTGALSAVYAGKMDSGELLSDLPTSVRQGDGSLVSLRQGDGSLVSLT